MESPFDIISNKTFALYIETILDPYSKEYIEVISLDVEPDGPLKECVFLAKNPELSPFKYPYNTKCIYYLSRYPGKKEYMLREDIPKVFSYFDANRYTINTSLTRLYRHNNSNNKELICVVKYEGI